MNNIPHRFLSTIACAAVLALVTSFSVQGQTLYWDANGPDPISSSATGDFETSLWSDDAAGQDFLVGWSNDSDYVFSTTGYIGTQTVTLTGNPDLANSFTFNQGTVTLLGSGASLSVGNINDPSAPSILDTSNDGPVTFDSSLGTVLLNSGSTFLPTVIIENDSTQSLIFNSKLSTSSTSPAFTFTGTGTGSTIINGQINLTGGAGVGIDQESTTSTLFLNSATNSVNSVTINGGTINALTDSSIGSAVTTLKNGATLTFQSGTNISQSVTVTDGATIDTGGDSGLKWGNGNTHTLSADTLTLGSGDDLDQTKGNSVSIKTLDLVNTGTTINTGHRLIVGSQGQGFGFLNEVGTTNLGSNYILDFGNSGNQTVNSVINVASGAAIEGRDNSGTITFGSNVVLPTSGMLTLGSDDLGGGVLNFAEPIALTGSGLTVALSGTNTTVVLSGNISGNAGLTADGTGTATSQFSSGLWIEGTNTYTGPTILAHTTGNQPQVVIAGNETGLSGAFNIQEGILYVDKSGTMPTTAVVTIEASTSHTYFEIGDGNGAATATVAGIQTDNVNNSADHVIGSSSTASTLILDPLAGQAFTYNGTVGLNTGNDSNLAIVKTGAGTQLLANTGNVYNGGTTINQGVLAVAPGGTATANVLGTGTTTINNAATLDVAVGNSAFPGTITLGTQGTVTYSGDSYQAAGILAGFNVNTGIGIDYGFSGKFVGGNNLIIGTGDDLAQTTVAGTPGNIYILGGRLLMLNNTTFISGATSVTTADGGIFDFGNISSAVANVPIYVGANGWLNERNSTVTINDLLLTIGTSGNTPSLTIGTDDSAGTSGSITVTNQVALIGNFQLNGEEANSAHANVVFSGGFGGTGNLTVSSFYATSPANTANKGVIVVSGPNAYKGDTTVSSGIFDLTGSSAAVTSASGGAPNYFVTGTVPATSVYNPGILQVGAGGSLATNANVTIGTVSQFAYLVIGDGSGAGNVTVGSIAAGGATKGSIINGDFHDATTSSLTVNVAANTTDTYTGTIGSDPNSYAFSTATSEAIGKFNSVANLNNLSLTKSGSGTLVLSGTNSYTGATTVNGGKLAINSSVTGGVTVNAGGEVGGAGKINGTIVGAGAVGPGNSPGILSAPQVNPTSGMSFDFEFTLAGSPPTFSNSSASKNDILHLEGATPFTAALTSANDINLYFSGVGTFEGGFFTNGATNNLTTNLANATYDFYVLDNSNGVVTYNGNRYDVSSGTASVIAAANAAFSDGTVSGFTESFSVNAPLVVPEPSIYALMGLAGLTLLVGRRLKA